MDVGMSAVGPPDQGRQVRWARWWGGEANGGGVSRARGRGPMASVVQKAGAEQILSPGHWGGCAVARLSRNVLLTAWPK